jgi:superfamily II DNA or RNA helicase
MSLKINLDILNDEQRQEIVDDLSVSPEQSQEGQKKFTFAKKQTSQVVELFEVENNDVIVPFAYGVEKLNIKRPRLVDFEKMNEQISFQGKLREKQVECKDKVIKNLNLFGTTLLSCYPGFGKTITSIYISTKIGLKTLIIVNRIVLMNQWKDAIAKFCSHAKVKILTPKKSKTNNNDAEENEADFFIINALNVSKFGSVFFAKIGTIIVDEAHLIMSQVLSQSLRFLFPKYLLGLSATPYRTDGMNILLKLYFTENKIIQKLYHPHTVYKIETGFTPEVEYDRNGTLIWNKIIESQSENKERNALILRLIEKYPQKTFLILTKRVQQANYLFEELQKKGEMVDTFMESKTDFNKSARILIATTSKGGVGFDHDKLDALILACDLEDYFIQYLGRVFRRQDIKPIIFDLVDNHPSLKRHFSTRRSVYVEAGGQIEKYKEHLEA